MIVQPRKAKLSHSLDEGVTTAAEVTIMLNIKRKIAVHVTPSKHCIVPVKRKT